MSALPKLQENTCDQPAKRRPIQAVAKSQSASAMMPANKQPEKPRYDFVGIAG